MWSNSITAWIFPSLILTQLIEVKSRSGILAFFAAESDERKCVPGGETGNGLQQQWHCFERSPIYVRFVASTFVSGVPRHDNRGISGSLQRADQVRFRLTWN